MTWIEAIRIAFGAIRANKLRSILTLIGVIVGVMVVVAVASVIEGANVYVSEKIANLGSQVVILDKFGIITNFDEFIKAQKRNKDLTLDDADALREQVKLAEFVGVRHDRTTNVKAAGQQIEDVDIGGVTANMVYIDQTVTVEQGRYLSATDEERHLPVAFIGTDLQDRFFPGVDPLGKEIRINGLPFEVVGVAKKQGSVLGQSQDNYALITITAFQRIYGSRDSISVRVKGYDGTSVDDLQDQIRIVMRARHHLGYKETDDFGFVTADAINTLWKSLTGLIALVAMAVVSISLVVVFIPLLLMGGIVGRLFREFAMTLSIAIAVSMVISLTATPMMCAHLLKQQHSHGWMFRTSERAFTWVVNAYGRTLTAVLNHAAVTLVILLATIGLNVYLFIHVPKGFFPQQDNGRMMGSIQADQDTSFQAMDRILQQMIKIIDADPAVDTALGFTGGGTMNTARMFISLKPLEERKITADQIIARLRPKLARVPGATLYLQAAQDVRVGGRLSNAQYQFTMRGDNLQDLTVFAPRMLRELRSIGVITDVSTDQQNLGLQSLIRYDRSTAARFGISPQLIDNTLYDAFGQRPVSTMYRALNQYHVVMEAAPEFWQNPLSLRDIYVRSPKGQEVPLSAFSTFAPTTAPLAVTHQGLFPAVTMSFNLQPGVALGDAVDEIDVAATKIVLPPTIHTGFAGTAQAYQQSLGSEPLLIAAALVTVYIVLGILYESYIHPITILSTLPSAGVGALLALLLTHTDLSVIAIIGIILLIGIVKKNAIMMIDFAIAAERNEGKNSRDSIFEACMLRFRPILMTTMAALLGALPLALGTGTGSELRRPLGITIIGGLIVSQVLTLYTTPVVYLYFDRLQHWWDGVRGRRETEPLGSEA